MSDYYGDATLEDWLAEEVFSISDAPIPPDVVALFEQWREGVEGQIRSWMDTDDGEGNRLSWRGWCRGLNGIPDSEQAAFEAAVVKGKAFLAGTWTAAIMPDDALPPDSLVGRMLNPLTDETGTGEVSFDPEPTPLPLWRVMEQAHEQEAGSVFDHLGNTVLGEPDRYTRAAEIEALRDWLLPEEPEPTIDTAAPGDFAVWGERQRLRALLTEQARIARGDS